MNIEEEKQFRKIIKEEMEHALVKALSPICEGIGKINTAIVSSTDSKILHP